MCPPRLPDSSNQPRDGPSSGRGDDHPLGVTPACRGEKLQSGQGNGGAVIAFLGLEVGDPSTWHRPVTLHFITLPAKIHSPACNSVPRRKASSRPGEERSSDRHSGARNWRSLCLGPARDATLHLHAPSKNPQSGMQLPPRLWNLYSALHTSRRRRQDTVPPVVEIRTGDFISLPEGLANTPSSCLASSTSLPGSQPCSSDHSSRPTTPAWVLYDLAAVRAALIPVPDLSEGSANAPASVFAGRSSAASAPVSAGGQPVAPAPVSAGGQPVAPSPGLHRRSSRLRCRSQGSTVASQESPAAFPDSSGFCTTFQSFSGSRTAFQSFCGSKSSVPQPAVKPSEPPLADEKTEPQLTDRSLSRVPEFREGFMYEPPPSQVPRGVHG
ncbi:hypothetical protein CRENBAI_008249 [Crenichthys baileyi]|uniref:Uncharacterized protein n=1 Tax=Crenichthys baileyi TaxID=28760 RepID=A0AAV9SLL3_9TELE